MAMAVETEATVRRVNYVEELNDYLCTLCGKITHNPRKTHCDQRVCSPCIEPYFQTKCETRIKCPVCANGEAEKLDAAPSDTYGLSDFEVDEAARAALWKENCYCWNRAAGCNEERPAKLLQRHIDDECEIEKEKKRRLCFNGPCKSSMAITPSDHLPSTDGELVWTIPGYKAQLERARIDEQASFYSPPFYSSRYGYKMRAEVYLNGYGLHKGKKMSIFFRINKGRCDHILEWPFSRKITFGILKPDADKEIRENLRTVLPDGGAPFSQPSSENNPITGCPDFVDLSLVRDKYISRDDKLTLFVGVETSAAKDSWSYKLLMHTRTVPPSIGSCGYSRYGCTFNAETLEVSLEHIRTSEQSHMELTAAHYYPSLEKCLPPCDNEVLPKKRVRVMKNLAEMTLRMMADKCIDEDVKIILTEYIRVSLFHIDKLSDELSGIDQMCADDIDIRCSAISKKLLDVDKEEARTILENGGLPSFNGTLIWKVSDYKAQLEKARSGELTSFYSPPFYTSPFGYKLRAKVHLNGDGHHKGKKMAIFLEISKGAYDHTLDWSFSREITFAIVKPRYETKENLKKIQPDGGAAFHKPTRELNPTTGCPDFIDVNLVEEYISQNDVLTLSVSVETDDDDKNWWKEGEF